MALPAPDTALHDYLAWEEAQADRHEFVHGEVFAMVGGRRVNGLVTLNLASALKQHLKGGRSRAFVESMKVQVDDRNVFYPDLFVTCDAADLQTEQVFRNPVLVVEVLSDSTQAFDRGLKFEAYRRLATLREYLLIDPDRRRVELFRRNERGLFELHDQSDSAQLQLASVELQLPMPELWDGLDAPGAALSSA